MPKKAVNLERSFGGALASQEIPVLKQRIEELEARLKETQGEIWLEVEKVRPNPNQPRKTFCDLTEFAALLNRDGQKEPILVVKVSEDDYLIFDGEKRWRSAKINKEALIKAFAIPYNPETFDDDVLISSIQKESLNSLDLAEALVTKILKLSIELDQQKILTSLNTAIMRFKRQGQQKQLGNLITTNLEERQEYFAEVGITEEAQLICNLLLDLGLNPASINQNQFPILKLPDDLKEAIRKKGLGDGQARAIAKVEAAKLNLTERKAQNLRSKIVDKVVADKLSVSKTSQLVGEETAQFRGDDASLNTASSKVSPPVKRCLRSIEKLPFDNLTDNEKSTLIEVLQQSLSQLQ